MKKSKFIWVQEALWSAIGLAPTKDPEDPEDPEDPGDPEDPEARVRP